MTGSKKLQPKLIILDGTESGIEVTLSQNRVYSIGNTEEADFFLSDASQSFMLFFKAAKDAVELWTDVALDLQMFSSKSSIHSETKSFGYNEAFGVAGRWFGVFVDSGELATVKSRLNETLRLYREERSKAFNPEEARRLDNDDSLVSNIPKESVDTSEAKQNRETKIPTVKKVTGDAISTESVSDVSGVKISDRVTESKQKNDQALEGNFDTEENDADEEVSKRQFGNDSRFFSWIKKLPFLAAILVIIGYIFVQVASPSKEQPLQKSEEERTNEQTTDKNVDQNLSAEHQAGVGLEYSTASGVPFNEASSQGFNSTTASATADSLPVSELSLSELRNQINTENRTITMEETSTLIPDEKITELIKDMLDTAGATGIDVRFVRGRYDVYGYVRDHSKWLRIQSLLTYDIDLSKVTFSVETSQTLLEKFEALLQKFSLSRFVVLSLDPNTGGIVARSYYPPALEGLWLTIVGKFEQRFSKYTTIKEYRAHIGWINVVKVSFDKPAFIHLQDGRRIVEGSVIGGESILDAVLPDAVKVRAGSLTRYYVINKSAD